MGVNKTLFNMAVRRAMAEKSAVVPPQPPMDPAAGAPMDPAAMGAAAPVDPAQAAAGAAPPPEGDPAAAPVDPNDPAMMGGLPPEPPPPDPSAAAPAQPKMKPEQMFQALGYQIYNMQQQLTAIINFLGVTVPAEALIVPPSSDGAPQAEDALPGGPLDPANAPTAQPPSEKIGQPISRELESSDAPLMHQDDVRDMIESIQDKIAAALLLKNRR